MRRSLTCLATTVVLWGVIAVTAFGQQWLLAGGDGTLRDYTQGASAAVNPRSITPAFPGSLVIGIDFAGDGSLFAASTYPDNRLYRINPLTGASALVGPTGLSDMIEGDIGFDPTTGVLYGLYNLSSGNQLFTLNTTSGAATVLGTVAGDDPSGLAFDNSGQMWVINSNINAHDTPTLLKVDKTNGTILSTMSMGPNIGNGHPFLGADFDPTTNQLYFAMGNGSFYSVNTLTGLATLVDSYGVFNTAGLARVVPEPQSLTLSLAGAAVLLWVATRRRRGLRSRDKEGRI